MRIYAQLLIDWRYCIGTRWSAQEVAAVLRQTSDHG